MNAQNCLQILRDVKDAAFATVDARGFPQARIIDVMLIEDETLYFCTARGKDFYAQLLRDGHVAVTAMNRDFQMVRLTGTARRLSAQKRWIDRIFAENPSMEGVYPGGSRYILEPFCIEDGELEFFDLSKEPIFRQTFSIGQGTQTERGFLITGACAQCGACEDACPQGCIRPGAPYAIDQAHCLHCGLCREVCPAGAVVRKGD